MLRETFVSATVLLLSACSAFNAYVNRDATENEVSLQESSSGSNNGKGPHRYSVIAFTANRRAIAVSNNSPGSGEHHRLIFCAEPPPDAISALMASDSANFAITPRDSEALKLQASSSFATAAKSIAARNPLVEVYRTSVYSICQLHANGVLTTPQAAAVFVETTKAVVEKMDGKAPVVDLGSGIQVSTTCSAASGASCSTSTNNKPDSKPVQEPTRDVRPECVDGEAEHAAGKNAAGKDDPNNKGCKNSAALSNVQNR